MREVYLCRLKMVEPVLAPTPMTLEVEPPGKVKMTAAIREETEKEVPEGETVEEKAEREKNETLYKGWSNFKVMSDPSLYPAARRVVGEYRDIFCDEIPKLPPRRSVKFAIDLEPGHLPPTRLPYQLSFGELDEMRRQLDDLLAKGFIRPPVSPFAVPAFFVVKKDGSLRMCIDYRAINKITIKDKYAMLRPEELLDRLHRAKIFLVLDMRQFFYQLRIRLGDEPKTAMCIRYGNYEWLVMPFGMCNPPPTSQRAIQIDDVLVYSPTVDQYEEDLRRVLGCLRKDEYYVKISKCKFFVPKVIYIGLEISDVGVRAEPKKAELVQTWPKLENKHELRVFLGLTVCNWFWRFIYKYSHVTAPLTSLLQAKVEFVCSEVCEAAFKELKEKIAELILLFIPDPTCPFDLYVDASEKEICITAALMQWDLRVNGLRVVALASRELVQAEQKYSIQEKELLAVVFGLKTFCIYVNHTTKVYSDHESLKWLGTSGGLIEGPNRVKRWAIFLNALGIVPQYIPGSKNIVADALSRRPSRTRTQKQTGEERSDEKETDRIA
uniref:Reverse transcriptase/retrotransposon-derived protein RNase H-like domain-containing protein n=1 Tax=Chromera velia CCMP2878 TaxID=1169474 RepID=A0A0G4HJJ3_9ALVE|eukprot:Cvel_28157.t1-p1 / transcript=Cvel_28157.t1 / gene=Cvel_28157 / organism=Chromera_velia_CCMP2878 / gene_product=Retrovirus-related Pol polyprotein from transposon, putative / transcript_product=Retrovirus-related Pol polyprotein from transposon, putative / location=Cvel_scaffold3637:6132-7826(+) / protein_length=551 / sequence_SO=supercontig / SO=protein_coding / is_pseudo=false